MESLKLSKNIFSAYCKKEERVFARCVMVKKSEFKKSLIAAFELGKEFQKWQYENAKNKV